MSPFLALAWLACSKEELPNPPAGGDSADPGGDTDSGDADGGGDAGGGGDDGGDAGDGGDTSPDTGEGMPLDINAEIVEEVVTVVRVWWTTEVPTRGYVRFGEDSSYNYATHLTEEGTSHEVLLLGSPAETEVHFEVVSVNGEAELESGDYTITTGTLPPDLPELYPSGQATSWDSFVVLPIQGTVTVATIIDNQGRYVWYDFLESGGNLMRVFLSYDRQEMIYCYAGDQSHLEDGKIVRVSLDGASTEETSAPYIDHDMVELPDGTIAAIVVTDYPGEDPPIELANSNADRIVEFHPDGSETTIWNAWDAFPELAEPNKNWTHGNALDYHPDTDTYTISLKDMQTILHIDRSTGETLWTLGGFYNEFDYLGGAEPLELHHQFELIEDGIIIFDNGSQTRGFSRAVEFSMDLEEMSVTWAWEYVRDPPVYVYAKGDIVRFDDEVTQVVWSTSGAIEDVTREGEVVWDLGVELGHAFTFVQHIEDFYVRE